MVRTPVELEIRLGVPESHRRTAAGLYDEAFSQKLAPVIPDRERRQELLSESLDLGRAIVALRGGQLLGLAGFHHDGRSLSGAIDWQGLRKHVGLWGALRATAVATLLERAPAPGELLMDGICVAPDARGLGLGTRLLRALCDHGTQLGVAHVRLDVIDTNPRARRLYEREGFVATETTELGPLKAVFGFSAATTMVKRLR